MQIADAAGTPLRGDLVTRVVLRTDLTPIPSTIEVEALRTDETVKSLAEGATIQVGGDMIEYLIVRQGVAMTSGLARGTRELATISAVGILNSCAAVGRRLQRSIIREGSTFAEIYRSIGASAVIDTDFTVPVFACYVGMLPTPEIARVLQEEAATVYLSGGKLLFRRLDDMIRQKANVEFTADLTEEAKSDYLERHAVPFAFTTTPDGALLATKREAARGIFYRPRADTRILNNVSSALIQRRKMRLGLSPELNAGARVDVDGAAHVVITAAHVRATPSENGAGDEYTQLWLGEFVK